MSYVLNQRTVHSRAVAACRIICQFAFIFFLGYGISRGDSNSPQSAQDYKLAPDDVISVLVLDEPSLTFEGITIGQTGILNFPIAGQVHVAGKTPNQVAEALEIALKKWIKNPIVTVSVKQERPQLVAVSGDVLKPDSFELKHVRNVLDAIAAAGWLKQPILNSRAFLHRNGERMEIRLSDAIDNHDPSANLILQAGDLITVEAQFLNIYVDGLVEKPGTYTLAEGDGVVQAIAKAEGLKVTADHVLATIRRRNDIIPVDLQRAAYDPTANTRLKDGDTLILGEPKIVRVQVTGEVQKPGPYRLPLDACTVIDALTAAGGLYDTLRAESARISVVRALVGKTAQTLVIDPIALLNTHDHSQNPKLEDGDELVVSEIRTETIFINGEVNKPGAYQLREGDDLADLIAQASGPTDFAALKRVSVAHRDGTTVTADIRAAVSEGGPKPNIALENGDTVTVPKNLTGVLVMQAVAKPGLYPLPEDRPFTVGDALSLAGGPSARAQINQVHVLRQTKNGVEKKIFDLRKTYDGQLATSYVLADRDVLFIPDGKDPTRNAGILNGIISTLGTFVAIHG